MMFPEKTPRFTRNLTRTICGIHTRIILTTLVLPLFAAVAPASDNRTLDPPSQHHIAQRLPDITSRTTSVNKVALKTWNDGRLGSSYASREASFEYPVGSSIDHMVRGGIWVGAVNAQEDTLVSTGAMDVVQSTSIPTEFTPLPRTQIEVRSVLLEDRYYHPAARSQEDFLCSFADTAFVQDHTPLGIQVDLEVLSFDFRPFNNFVILNYSIVNLNPYDALYDLYAGMYADLITVYKDPSHTRVMAAYSTEKAVSYVDSLRILTGHHRTPSIQATSWCGVKLLGTGFGSEALDIDTQQISCRWEVFSPGGGRDDAHRYRLMSSGTVDTPGERENGVSILSIGPFPTVYPGDTVRVSFAFVGGEDAWRQTGRTAQQDLLYNAQWAQNAYDLDFRLPSPPPSPAPLEVIPGYNEVTLRWTGELSERFIDPRDRRLDFEGYRIYMSERKVERDFKPILERDLVNSIGYDTGLEDIRTEILAPAETVLVQGPDSLEIHILPEIWQYEYTIRGLRDGFKHWVAVTAFDHGTESIPSLESGLSQNRTLFATGGPPSVDGAPRVSVFPNPYRGDAVWDGSLRRDRFLWFTNLPPRCVIRIYTLAGDLVETIDFDQATYQARDIRGIFDPTNPRNPDRDLPTLSGGMAAWDLVTRKDQGIASGLYIFSVDDRDTGQRQLGRFLVIK